MDESWLANMRKDHNQYIEHIKQRYHYNKITKIMESLLCLMGIILVISLVFVINLHSDNLLWSYLILICGVGIILMLMIEFVYIGFVIDECY